jgi:hypothetical protein
MGYTNIDQILKKIVPITFTRVDNGKSVKFTANITDFSDSYSPNWNTNDAYGKMDGTPTYSRTSRSISLGFAAIGVDAETATDNLSKVSSLTSFTYPTYKKNLINSPPLIRISFAGLISESGKGLKSRKGLTGYLTSLSVTPDFEPGVFIEKNWAVPKVINISCAFTVVHDIAPNQDFSPYIGSASCPSSPAALSQAGQPAAQTEGESAATADNPTEVQAQAAGLTGSSENPNSGTTPVAPTAASTATFDAGEFTATAPPAGSGASQVPAKTDACSILDGLPAETIDAGGDEVERLNEECLASIRQEVAT